MSKKSPSSTNPAWTILGAGSIGGLFAAHMSANGTACRLLLKDAQFNAWQANPGIQITIDQQTVIQPVAVEKISASTAIHYLVIATKAHQTFAALDSIKHRLHPHAVICLLQNGMGISEKLLADYPYSSLLQASSSEGVNRPDKVHHPFQLVHAGRANTIAGMIRGEKRHAEQFAAACGPILNVEVTDDIETVLWRKLAVNSVINPLTAINDCDNGLLAQIPLRNAVQQLCDELELFATVFSEKTGKQKTFQQIRKQVFTVIEQTAKNCSSMRADIRAKRKTEIDFITGFLCTQAQHYSINLPRHAALLQLIRLKESAYDE